jgi:oligopeptide/dipeptide ABC transporter ATP-binding protein
MDRTPLLEVRGLATQFRTDAGLVRAVDGASFALGRGETLALVGESGCGKSVTALSILGLLPRPQAAIAAGSIRFAGEELVGAPEARLRQIRGNEIAMIFQEPMTSLNPVYTVGDQIIEAITLHRGLDYDAARARAIEMLGIVGIPAPAARIDEYPHQLSGGMRQRVMIAMALSCEPQLLIADEPTTALDGTIQAQILDLLRRLQAEFGMSVLLITHDLGVVAEMAHRVVVMYAGKVVEAAGVIDLFERPRHPYTAGLFASLPVVGGERRPLRPIPGIVPDPRHLPSGCAFHPRCRFALERCRTDLPPLAGQPGPAAHQAACWFVAQQPTVDLLAESRA